MLKYRGYIDLSISDGHFHLDTRLNTNGGNLLHNFTGAVQVNQPLVDTHLVPVEETTFLEEFLILQQQMTRI